MKVLARKIARELSKAKHYAVYEEDLTRVWPHNGERRERQIALFAKEHGWRVGYYKKGMCAIFVKSDSASQSEVPCRG
jgi:hypothetical protein